MLRYLCSQSKQTQQQQIHIQKSECQTQTKKKSCQNLRVPPLRAPCNAPGYIYIYYYYNALYGCMFNSPSLFPSLNSTKS